MNDIMTSERDSLNHRVECQEKELAEIKAQLNRTYEELKGAQTIIQNLQREKQRMKEDSIGLQGQIIAFKFCLNPKSSSDFRED